MSGESPASTDGAVVSCKRFDVFLSFHGSECLETALKGGKSPSSKKGEIAVSSTVSSSPAHASTTTGSNTTDRTTVRQLAYSVAEILVKGGRHGRIPSVFLDDRELSGKLSQELYHAILQTRGNGVALCILTRAYLRRRACLSELLSFLELDRRRKRGNSHSMDGAVGHIKLRLVCLEEDGVGNILSDPLVQRYLPDLEKYRIHQIKGNTMSVISEEISDIVWKSWTGQQPTILGGSVQESFLDLCTFFSDDDVPLAKMVLDLPNESRASDVIDVLHQWRERAGFYNVEPLHKLAVRIRRADSEALSAMINAYHEKWIGSSRWSWDQSEADQLLAKEREAQEIIEQSRMDEYRRKEEMERSSVDLSVLLHYYVVYLGLNYIPNRRSESTLHKYLHQSYFL